MFCCSDVVFYNTAKVNIKFETPKSLTHINTWNQTKRRDDSFLKMKSKSFHDVRLVKLKVLWKTCKAADREIGRFCCVFISASLSARLYRHRRHRTRLNRYRRHRTQETNNFACTAEQVTSIVLLRT